jgi:exosome complex RNA-binding protein Csl4
MAGIIANVVEGVASNAITNRMQKGKANGMDNDEIWELENGKITAIVRGGVRYVKEKKCYGKPHYDLTIGNDFLTVSGVDCSECGGRLDLPVKAFYCPNCGARVVK